MTTKIGCVQHDCDKCKAQAENNAELLRTVRVQAAELETLRSNYTSLKKMVDEGGINERILSAGIEQEREIKALQADLDTALMDVTCIPDMTEEITFLRAELEGYKESLRTSTDWVHELQAKLDAIQKQEPVAWREWIDGWQYSEESGSGTPLYAQPVAPQQGPAKDHEVRELVNRLTEVAKTYHATQQLRERIAGEIRPFALQQPVAQPAPLELTNDDVRAVGGIVHRDGNVFFTNVALLNKAIATAKDKS
jgi:hypothetical protein